MKSPVYRGLDAYLNIIYDYIVITQRNLERTDIMFTKFNTPAVPSFSSQPVTVVADAKRASAKADAYAALAAFYQTEAPKRNPSHPINQ